MANIIINGLNSKVGGGKSILTNFLSLLASNTLDDKFVVLVPNVAEFKMFENNSIKIMTLPNFCTNNLSFPVLNRWILPRLIKKYNCHLLFNLADVPVPTPVKQIFLFDWPYAVYPESPVWKMMDFRDWLKRKIKLYYFKKYLKHVDVMIAQSTAMKQRLETLYNLKDIRVVPNAVSLDNLSYEITKDYHFEKGLNLLCLSHYYVHKNLEIFIPLAKEIIARGEKIHIVTTIDPRQHPKAEAFLREVNKLGLNTVINNVGPVRMEDVPSLYAQTDGLLLPTLLESFSGTYVEAMFHEKPIFTSDMDFATGVCGDAAYYFAPFNPQEILQRIIESQNNPLERQNRVNAGKRILAGLPSWEQTFKAYLELFNFALK